jgi:hypothetical protein
MWRQLTHLVMTRGLSSAGRALPLQGRGQGFESPRLHKCVTDARQSHTLGSTGSMHSSAAISRLAASDWNARSPTPCPRFAHNCESTSR